MYTFQLYDRAAIIKSTYAKFYAYVQELCTVVGLQKIASLLKYQHANYDMFMQILYQRNYSHTKVWFDKELQFPAILIQTNWLNFVDEINSLDNISIGETTTVTHMTLYQSIIWIHHFPIRFVAGNFDVLIESNKVTHSSTLTNLYHNQQ